MTTEPALETDAMLAIGPPSDWPAFARALEIQRNAARAVQDELNRQLSVALKGKRPYSSEFADETIAAQVKRIAELEEKLNGWFSERDALRAEISQLRAELADERAKKSDERHTWDRDSGSNQGGNAIHPLMDCPKCGKFRGHGHVCNLS